MEAIGFPVVIVLPLALLGITAHPVALAYYISPVGAVKIGVRACG
jgi:hypothetical protein